MLVVGRGSRTGVGSTDGSIEIAQRLGARVVHVSQRGYGSALYSGTKAARGRYVIMADAESAAKVHTFIDAAKQVETLLADECPRLKLADYI